MMNLRKNISDKSFFNLLLIVVILLLGGCRSDDLDPEENNGESGENGEVEVIDMPDWSEESHGSSFDPNYELVFDHGEVIRFDIVIDPDDWADMQQDLSSNLGSSGGRPGGGMVSSSDYTPIWAPCSFFYNDTEWYKVGIRFKGNSSLFSSYSSGIDKLSFKLDFNEYENDYAGLTDQRFYGFRQLNLKNNYDDRSLVREKVGSDLFREFGLASPKTAFCVVYVDHGSGPIYYGVYTLVEEVDDTVMDSQFAGGEGNLYKPDGSAASFAAGTYNESEMEKRSNELLADYSDVFALYNAINSSARSTDAESWKAEVNACFDVDVFLQWLASNTAMQNWDTYGIMTHNYYLYNNPANGLLTWIPWDNNEAFQEGKQGGALSLSLSEVGSNWPLISYLIDVNEYQEAYREYLGEFAEMVFNPDRMIDLYSQYHELLKEYAYAESAPYTFIFSDATFDSAIEGMKQHVQARALAIQNYLD